MGTSFTVSTPATYDDWAESSEPPPLARGEVHLWRMRVPAAGLEPDAWPQLLNEEERARLARKRRPADRQRELTSRATLRQLLGAYLGRTPSTITLSTEPGGKPALAGARVGERIEFNVSHAGDWVLLAFALGLRVGVDVEAWSELSSDEIVRGYFAPAEREAWRQISTEDKQAAFFAAWTRKEAYLKALGLGLGKPLDSFAVRFTPSNMPPELLWCADDPLAPQRWKIAACDPAPGYSGAVAVEAPEAPVVRLTAQLAPPSG